jgi:hypothetical protein
MDGGVKHRLSNVLAWMGFVALVGVLPFILMIPGVIWEKYQETPVIENNDCYSWRDMANNDNWLISEDAEGFNFDQCEANGGWAVKWSYKGEKGWAYTNRYYRPKDYLPGYNRPWSDAARDFDGLFSVALPTWIVILVINYIFWGSMRILPWKKVSDDD